MKYDSQHVLQCFMRQSTWYREENRTMAVRGVLIHCTGSNNPYVKRYVQPDYNDPNRQKLLDLIGVNKNNNDWNHSKRDAGVSAFIGKLADGTVSSVQVGPWNKWQWGCGKGQYGSCNNGWIQFEMCEDELNDRAYFNAVFEEAAQLTAYLCTLYNLNPQGKTKLNGHSLPVIMCHQDAYRYGFGSNHYDVYNWFGGFEVSMNDFRARVNAIMKEEASLTYEQWKEYMVRYQQELDQKPVPDWAIKNGEWEKGKELGVITDSTKPMQLCTKAEAMAFALRASKES